MKRTKKQYESPQMEVFELKHHPQLLAGSFTGNRNNPYGDPETPEGW